MERETNLAHQILEVLQKLLPRNDFIALHEPCLDGNEWKYLKECVDTGWVSSVGKFVDVFEAKLEHYTGAKKVVAVVNGTAALHISLRLVGVGTGDEVIIPALTFVATANAVSYCGAIPHFVDSEEKTLGLDPHKLNQYLHEIAEIRGGQCFNKKTNRRIKAVVPMHTFGHSVDLESLLEVGRRFKLEIVEDAAEALGSRYKGKHTGNWGRISALSFNGNKIITTGGGGAILTNDEALGRLAKHLTTTAKVSHEWIFAHDQVGYNYRMPNINAALGCAQLENLDFFIRQKRQLAMKYEQAFAEVRGVRTFKEPEFAQSNYWLNTLLLDENKKSERDATLAITNQNGIMTRPVWELMHTLEMYANCPRMDLAVAENLAQRIINIPSSVFLGGTDE